MEIFKRDVMKWIGTLSFLLAAVLLSSNIEISRYGFFVFSIRTCSFKLLLLV